MDRQQSPLITWEPVKVSWFYWAAPGVAKSVFNLKIAPIKDLVMGIIDEVEHNGSITLRASEQ